ETEQPRQPGGPARGLRDVQLAGQAQLLHAVGKGGGPVGRHAVGVVAHADSFAEGPAGGVVNSGARTPTHSSSISVRSNAAGSAARCTVRPWMSAWQTDATVCPDTLFARAAAGLAVTRQWAAIPCRHSAY